MMQYSPNCWHTDVSKHATSVVKVDHLFPHAPSCHLKSYFQVYLPEAFTFFYPQMRNSVLMKYKGSTNKLPRKIEPLQK